MPYKNIEDRRARLKELRKRHPDKEYKAYKEKVLKTCSPEKQEHYKRLWAKKELPKRQLEVAIQTLKFYAFQKSWADKDDEQGRLAELALVKIKEMENDRS